MKFSDKYDGGYFEILSEVKSKDGSVMKILALWIQSDHKNRNGRMYPKSLLTKEVARLQEKVEEGRLLGTADNSDGSALANLKRLVGYT